MCIRDREYPDVYRLVDVSKVRDVRLTIHLAPGFLKALRLAASLLLPVRLLPLEQPSEEVVAELKEAVDFYLHDPQVEMPIDFFHSALASARGLAVGDLWMILQQDPGRYPSFDESGAQVFRGDLGGRDTSTFYADHLKALVDGGAECAKCSWREFCSGYFKLPDPNYSCAGLIEVLGRLRTAAAEIESDLTGLDRRDRGAENPARDQ